jgi:hypothetical protein
MQRILALTFALSLVVLGVTESAEAQASTTEGFNLGIHASGASLVVESGERNNAGGGGLWVGYGFNPTVEVFFQGDGAQFDVQDASVEGTWTLAHADLGVRFHFANAVRSWVPYLQAAITGRVVEVEDGILNSNAQSETISLLGGGLTLGGGVVFHFNESLGLDLQLLWTGGTFTELEVGSVTLSDLDIEAQSSRFNIGLSWWP